VHRAGQRLGQRRVLQRHVVRHMQRILGHDAGRDADELGIGAVVEEQIVAEVLLAALAEIALAAGGGVERHHAVAGGKVRDSLAGLDHRSRQLMAKQRRRHDHARMIAAAKDLQVRAAGERRAHADNQLAGPGLGNRHLLDADILASVEDRGLHGAAAVQERVLDRFAAQADGGFDRLAAFDDHRLDGVEGRPQPPSRRY
jgi:ribosomal protein L35